MPLVKGMGTQNTKGVLPLRSVILSKRFGGGDRAIVNENDIMIITLAVNK